MVLLTIFILIIYRVIKFSTSLTGEISQILNGFAHLLKYTDPFYLILTDGQFIIDKIHVSYTSYYLAYQHSSVIRLVVLEFLARIQFRFIVCVYMFYLKKSQFSDLSDTSKSISWCLIETTNIFPYRCNPYC